MEKVTNGVAWTGVSTVVIPWYDWLQLAIPWYDWLQLASSFAGQIVPILSALWLIINIVSKTRERTKGKSNVHEN